VWLTKLFKPKQLIEVEQRNRLLTNTHVMDNHKIDALKQEIDTMRKFMKNLEHDNKVHRKALEIMSQDMEQLQRDNEELQSLLVRALK
jgi:hypothetical protein